MYILRCSNDAYYTGSTVDLQRRLRQHQSGEGANFTKKHLPVELIYFEEFERVDQAFYREKQVQGWSRAKKEALMKGDINRLKKLAECRNETHFDNVPFGFAQGTGVEVPFGFAQGTGVEVPFGFAQGTGAVRSLSAVETNEAPPQ